ncbi:MAG: glycoside hydrolase family 88 protein [Oscillospiraceae bacterium]|nr:glycoside hydrolase family 88 protein [Oscillospiraceae bacterium]
MYDKIDAYILRLINESTPERTIWNIEKIRQGAPASWNYIDGCMITALMAIANITGDKRYFDFAENFISSFVSEDSTIRTFEPEKYTLDDVNEGRVLFELYEKTGKEKYRLAADKIRDMLLHQPRTYEYSYWHKLIYPNQVWLDGLYMAQPFMALYEKNFGDKDYTDVVRQIETVRTRMFDEDKRLYYHGYDASKMAFWADKKTGLSRSFWLRAIGWFSVALADIVEILPEGEERDSVVSIFQEAMEGVVMYQDHDTGLYWQVVDQPGREGNYLETSGSSMLAYAMLKGARLGVLANEYAAKGQKTFNGIVDKYLSFTDGELNLDGICLVAGLGPENNRRRDGSFEYYISEPIVKNDAKGVAPFILVYTEIKRLNQ